MKTECQTAMALTPSPSSEPAVSRLFSAQLFKKSMLVPSHFRSCKIGAKATGDLPDFCKIDQLSGRPKTRFLEHI